MRKERFWFGTALAVLPVLMLLTLFVPSMKSSRGGPLEGHVKVQGRPLAGGFILFVPDDPKANTAIGLIDEAGHYQIESRWLRGDAEAQSHFRICLIPNQGDDRRSHGLVNEPARLRDGEAHDESDRPVPIMKVAAGLPRRLTDPRTSKLEVLIGPGPTRVDITL